MTNRGDYLTADPSTLPGSNEWDGRVYVIEFDNGTIKIGSTINPRQRVTTHQKAAEAFGIALTRCWVSRGWPGYRDGERSLLAEADKLTGTALTREWFQGLDFDRIVAVAPEVTYSNRGGQARRRRAAIARGDIQASFDPTVIERFLPVDPVPEPPPIIAALLAASESEEDRKDLYDAWLFNRRRYDAKQRRRAA